MNINGTPSYAHPSVVDSANDAITGFCKQHGEYTGDNCLWIHVGHGDEFCSDHRYWYSGNSGCVECNTDIVTGYCADHNETWYGVIGHCPVTGKYGTHEGSGGGSDGSGSSGSIGGSGNISTGVVSDGDLDSNYVVNQYTDLTFLTEDKAALKEALDIIRDGRVGDFICDKIADTGDFVRFTIVRTQERLDQGSGVWFQVPAQYSENVITFNPETDIGYGNLGEELIHAAQHRIYGSEMKGRDLNYEFEAKIIGSLMEDGLISYESMRFNTRDGVAFSEFIGFISGGISDDQKLLSEYQKYFELWVGEGYTDQEGYDKSVNFNPQLLLQINHMYHK